MSRILSLDHRIARPSIRIVDVTDLNHKRKHTDQCSWCSLSSAKPLPTAFCWTKMQAESGQSLELIVRRKELERLNGQGVFYWGIGNALGPSVTELLSRTANPEVLFSVMRAKPKPQDVCPTSLFLWTASLDEDNELQPLPPHVLVLSRGDTASGAKHRHYALVCHSEEALSPSSLGSLDLAHFRNLGGAKGKVGHSQVTANIEHCTGDTHGNYYEINLRTKLHPPYFIVLREPRRLSDQDHKAIAALVAKNPNPEQWRDLVNGIRSHPG